jgi:predicted unusual protein kinase regulating ubiquinone biosynthesis (AarF/ABC1/UbiB family)
MKARYFIKIIITLLNSERPGKKQLRLITILISMGGVYIKFAQLLLLRNGEKAGALRRDYSYLLKRTYDATPVEPIDIQRLLHSELGHKRSSIATIEHQPFASGSFGQVYKAQLISGEIVAIKAIKPSVLRSVKTDMRILAVLVRILSWTGSYAINIRTLFSDLRDTIYAEIDYEAELYNTAVIREQYERIEDIIVPKVYEALSTKHVIVQEFIDGLALTDVLEHHVQGIASEEYVRQQIGSDLEYQMMIVGREMLTSMLNGGMAHGDPHPGNILLLPNNRVALIDFGICTPGPANKHAFYTLIRQYRDIYVHDRFEIDSFTVGIISLFAEDLISSIRSLDRYSYGQVSDRFMQAIQEGVREIYNTSSHEVESLIQEHKYASVFESVINEDNRFGLHIELDEPLYIRAAMLYLTLLNSLGIKKSVMAQGFDQVCQNFENQQLPDTSKVVRKEDAVAMIAQWLEEIASRDIFLYQLIIAKVGRGALRV